MKNKPLMYEKTADGFLIFHRLHKSKKPDQKNTRFSYRVRVDGKK